MHQDIINSLYGTYNTKGYLVEDEVFECLIKSEVSLFEVDKITGELLALGVVFKSNAIESNLDDIYEDKSQIDYEKMYIEIIDIDDSIKPLIEKIRKIEPPKRNESSNLILQAKEGNLFAKNRIIEMYLKTAVRQAFLYHKKYNAPLSDCIQEALIGVVTAYEKYDTSKSDNFLIYATNWIRQAINRNCIVGNPHIYIPVHVKEKLYKVYELYNNHSCELCNKSGICLNFISYVKENTELDYEEIVMLVSFCTDALSLDELIEEDEKFTLQNFSNDDVTLNSVMEKDLKLTIDYMLSLVSERERDVLDLRFGLTDHKEKTLEEIAKEQNVTRERIRQIEAKALKKLKSNYKVKALLV